MEQDLSQKIKETRDRNEEKYGEIEFHRHLIALANMCQFTLTEETISVYDTIFAKLGYRNAVRGLQKVILTRKSSDRMPAVSEIVSAIDTSGSDQSRAVEVADRVWLAVAQWGWCNKKTAQEQVGPLGAKVIDRVGWEWLTSLETSQGNTAKAQLRECAKAILDQERSELIDKILGKTLSLAQETKLVTQDQTI